MIHTDFTPARWIAYQSANIYYKKSIEQKTDKPASIYYRECSHIYQIITAASTWPTIKRLLISTARTLTICMVMCCVSECHIQ